MGGGQPCQSFFHNRFTPAVEYKINSRFYYYNTGIWFFQLHNENTDCFYWSHKDKKSSLFQREISNITCAPIQNPWTKQSFSAGQFKSDHSRRRVNIPVIQFIKYGHSHPSYQFAFILADYPLNVDSEFSAKVY